MQYYHIKNWAHVVVCLKFCDHLTIFIQVLFNIISSYGSSVQLKAYVMKVPWHTVTECFIFNIMHLYWFGIWISATCA